MIKRSTVRNTVVLASLLLTFPNVSFAFLGELKATLGFEVKAGVDKETLEVIKTFPTNTRIEIFKILDRTDRSVYGYLDEANKLVRNTVDEFACAAEGITYGAGKGLKRILGFDPKDVAAMKEALIEVRGDIKYKTTVDSIISNYADYDSRARQVLCAEGRSSSTGLEMVRLRTMASTSYILWARLRELCTSSEECYALVYNTLTKNITLAAKQDISVTKADERLTFIPQKPAHKTSFLNLTNTFDVMTYEKNLGEMLRLNDQLLLVSSARIAKGKIYLDELETSLAAAEQNISTNTNGAASPDVNVRIHTCNIGYFVSSQIPVLQSRLNTVNSYELLPKPEIDKIENRITKANDRAIQLKALSYEDVRNNGNQCSYIKKARTGTSKSDPINVN